MPAEVNANHMVAQFERAHIYLQDSDTRGYYACGVVVITPFFVFVSGHYGDHGLQAIIVSKAIPREDIRMIDDQSAESCETHDIMDAEAKALMEKLSAKEDRKN